MKNQIDKQLEEFIDNVFENSNLESPSVDFSIQVMSKIQAINSTNTTTYKPLISRPVWIALGVIFVTFLSVVFGNATFTQSSWLTFLDFSIVSRLGNIFPSNQLPSSLVYAILFFGIMLLVQLTWLKNYFNKRLQF
ncbi:hypothetical protein [Mangrovimonas spongiae]|uniref:Uncharacterized protein n=1 Tax=Mangrovimonas spongiae TaxID=2494697 RepID=A0A3R9MFJ6_9FLAO|nr:hypothetical protein [Mangrovimonas spongiae]RSK39230.1 hypothetical protein EJA19_09865 [Mangrovimonas spongiae]